jgi:hypothetical protein
MDKVRKPSNSVCYTPSSEPYRIYRKILFVVEEKARLVPHLKIQAGLFLLYLFYYLMSETWAKEGK